VKRLLVFAACSTAQSAPTPQETVTPARVQTASITRRVGNDSVTIAIDSVQLVASVDGGVATDRPAYARKDQTVTLHAVLRAGKTAYSDAREVQLAGTKLTTRPLTEAPTVSLRWLRIEPSAANTSNTQSGSFRFEPIEYQTTAIEAATDLGSIAADVHPTRTPDHGAGLGTMRFQLVVTQGTRTLSTPGIDARRGRGSGGLTDAVLRVSIRRDDSLIGFMTEMMGQPYVWASAGLTDATHQSERLEGSDCADLMVYGARRAGKRIAYTWTGGLPAVSKLLASGTRGEDGIYRDKRGKPLPYPQEGDLILFPRHVGALTQDKGTKGVLDDQDIMLHTLFDSPKEQPIADSGYADTAVEIRRFR
jgi:cell wall-associated NlpC family hydrolase